MQAHNGFLYSVFVALNIVSIFKWRRVEQPIVSREITGNHLKLNAK